MKNGDSLSSYQQAEEFFQFWLNPSHQMVKNDVVLSCWIKDSHCFCYIKQTQNGKEYRLVDAKAATNITAFDHGALANILGQERAQEIDPDNLPIHDVFIELSPLRVFFTAFNKSWLFNSESNCCREVDKLHSMSCNAYSDDKTFLPLSPFLGRGYCLESPSGALSVFVSDHNLWLKNQKTGEKTQLTKDGEKGNSYGGGLFDHAVPALWSPDSCHLICARWDDSAASDSTLDLVPDDGLPWRVRPGRKALSGDEHIESLELITIDISTGNISTPDYPLLMQVSSIGAQRPGFFRVNMAWWSTDNRTAYFVDVARGAKSVRVVEWDTRTERTRVLLEESTSTFCSLSHSCNFDRPSMLPLPDSNELIWFSERSGWAHLYLYCLATGELKQTITKGNWLVRDVLHFDLRSRELLLQTAGRNTGINPYYRDICKVNIDTGELTTLASGNYDYCVYHYISDWVSNWSTMVGLGGGIVNNAIHGISPCGHYLVATRSRVDMPPETLLIGRHGKEILTVEAADVSGLPESWCWPEPVKLLGADGRTDIYGVVFRPPGYSSNKRYPVIEYCSSSRLFTGSPAGSFSNSTFCGLIYTECSALAALGFIVVVIDGRGTPLRHRGFLDHHYGEFYYTSDFEDRISGIRQLAKRDSAMDLDRVGIVGTENLTNSVYALLKHSDFYKVSVLHCFYDPRGGNATINEIADGRQQPSNPEDYADSFGGKLLLVLGMRSQLIGVQFQLVEALQKANKDFDMLCLPKMGNAMSDFSTRQGWDYLVRNLQGIEPPQEFKLESHKTKIYSSSEYRAAMASVLEETIAGIKNEGSKGSCPKAPKSVKDSR